MTDHEEMADTRHAHHELGEANRPSLVVEWLDGHIATYTLATGSAVEDTEGRKLIIKQPHADGGQHHRVVIPFEALRGWTVYPRLGEEPPPPTEAIAMHYRFPDGNLACPWEGREVRSTSDQLTVTCSACLLSMPRLPR